MIEMRIGAMRCRPGAGYEGIVTCYDREYFPGGTYKKIWTEQTGKMRDSALDAFEDAEYFKSCLMGREAKA